MGKDKPLAGCAHWQWCFAINRPSRQALHCRLLQITWHLLAFHRSGDKRCKPPPLFQGSVKHPRCTISGPSDDSEWDGRLLPFLPLQLLHKALGFGTRVPTGQEEATLHPPAAHICSHGVFILFQGVLGKQ